MAKQLIQNFLFSGSFYKGKIYLIFLCVLLITCNFVKESKQSPFQPLRPITVASTNFIDKQNINNLYTSPQLSWSAIPSASSYMVFLIDSNKESIYWLSYNIVSNSLNNNDESIGTLVEYYLPKIPKGAVIDLSFVVVVLDENSLSLNASRSNEFATLIINLMKYNYFQGPSSTTLFQDNSSPGKDVNIIGLGKIDVVIDNPSSACPDMDKSEGLLISEVNEYWMELVNTGSASVCLGDYQLRAFGNEQSYSLFSFNTNLVIASQEYIVVRFEKGNYESPQTIFLDKVSLFKSKYAKYNGGFAELVFGNRSSDFVRFCNSSGEPYLPLSGTFIGCLDFTSAISITRDQQLKDSDTANDWRALPVPTYGGPNDVIDAADNDRDGIPDANEMPGTTFAGMPVYEWGARADQRDIFVHINYMEGFKEKPGLDPREDSLNKIKEVFLNNDFYIHFDTGTRHSAVVDPAKFNLSGEDHQVPYSEYTEMLTVNKGYTPVITNKEIPTTTSLHEYKYKYFPNPRLQAFHYALFANIASQRGEKRPNVKGVAELLGNDVIIFLGASIPHKSGVNQTKNVIASTLFHELGHNLSLKHGGKNHLPSYKPNFLSSMNYLYVYNGLPILSNTNQNNFFDRYKAYNSNSPLLLNGISSDSFIIDFSHGDMEDIDEDMVHEKNPLPSGGFGDIDWNLDSEISGNAYSNDVNKDNKKQVLEDYDEWENLSIPFEYNNIFYRSLEIPFALDGRELGSHNSLERVPDDKYRFYNQDQSSPTIECEFLDLERFKKTFYSNPDLGKD